MSKELVCVCRKGTVEEADLVVTWLAEQGIEARVLDHENPGVMAFGVTDFEGIAVFVAEEETAQRARTLLEDFEVSRHASSDAGSVQVTCGECGAIRTLEGALRGTVQECRTCGTFLDVPEA